MVLAGSVTLLVDVLQRLGRRHDLLEDVIGGGRHCDLLLGLGWGQVGRRRVLARHLGQESRKPWIGFQPLLIGGVLRDRRPSRDPATYGVDGRREGLVVVTGEPRYELESLSRVSCTLGDD